MFTRCIHYPYNLTAFSLPVLRIFFVFFALYSLFFFFTEPLLVYLQYTFADALPFVYWVFAALPLIPPYFPFNFPLIQVCLSHSFIAPFICPRFSYNLAHHAFAVRLVTTSFTIFLLPIYYATGMSLFLLWSEPWRRRNRGPTASRRC